MAIGIVDIDDFFTIILNCFSFFTHSALLHTKNENVEIKNRTQIFVVCRKIDNNQNLM